MSGSPRSRRVVALGVVLLLGVAACGGNDAADPERACEINTELHQLGSLDQDREVVAETRNLLDEALRVAPEETRPSLEIVVDSLTVFYDALEAADFDEEQMELPDELDPSSEDAAFDAVDEWIDANCST